MKMVYENVHLKYMDIFISHFPKPSEVHGLWKVHLKYMVYENVHLKYMVFENVHLNNMAYENIHLK